MFPRKNEWNNWTTVSWWHDGFSGDQVLPGTSRFETSAQEPQKRRKWVCLEPKKTFKWAPDQVLCFRGIHYNDHIDASAHVAEANAQPSVPHHNACHPHSLPLLVPVQCSGPYEIHQPIDVRVSTTFEELTKMSGSRVIWVKNYGHCFSFRFYGQIMWGLKRCQQAFLTGL